MEKEEDDDYGDDDEEDEDEKEKKKKKSRRRKKKKKKIIFIMKNNFFEHICTSRAHNFCSLNAFSIYLHRAVPFKHYLLTISVTSSVCSVAMLCKEMRCCP